MDTLTFIAGVLGYGLGCYLAMHWLSGRPREMALAVLHVLFFLFILHEGAALNWFFTLDEFAIFESLLVYALIRRLVMRRLTGLVREAVLAVIGTACVLVLFFNGN